MKRLRNSHYDTLDYFIIERHHTRSFPAYFKTGWGNGYAVIPKNHPCYEMHYDIIHAKYDINVHRGLTFGRNAKELKSWPIKKCIRKNKLWIVGFDTAHYGDNEKTWPKSRVLKEARKLAKQLNEIK